MSFIPCLLSLLCLFSPPFSATDSADEERRASVHPGAVGSTPGREADSPLLLNNLIESLVISKVFHIPGLLLSRRPQTQEGSVRGRQGEGDPCTLSMPLFPNNWIFLFKYVAFGCLNDLRNLRKFFLAQIHTCMSNVEIYAATRADTRLDVHRFYRL